MELKIGVWIEREGWHVQSFELVWVFIGLICGLEEPKISLEKKKKREKKGHET